MEQGGWAQRSSVYRIRVAKKPTVWQLIMTPFIRCQLANYWQQQQIHLRGSNGNHFPDIGGRYGCISFCI